MSSNVTKLHTTGAIRLNHATVPIDIDGGNDFNIDPGITEVVERGAGQTQPSFAGAMQVMSMASFTATDVGGLLTAGIYEGIPIIAAGPYTSADIFWTQMKRLGTRETGAAHFRTKVNEGLLLATELSWEQNSIARLSCQIHAVYDNTNTPFVYTDSVALPFTPMIDTLFTGGKVTINGVDVPGVVGATLNFGNDVLKEAGGGSPYPGFVGIREQEFVYEIRTKHVPSMSDFGLEGALGATGATIYFTKMKLAGTRVPAATAEHLSFTVPNNQSWIYCGPYTASQNQSANGVIRLRLLVGASPIVTFSATATGAY